MTRAAAIALVGMLAATPAAAACYPLAEALPRIEAFVGEDAIVRPLPAFIAPGILDYLKASLVPGPDGTDGYVAAVTDRGIILFPVAAGQVCDGTAASVSVPATPGFLAHLKEWMDARGYSKERGA